MFLHSFAYFFSVGLRTKFKVTNFLFSSIWQLGRGKYNVPTVTKGKSVGRKFVE